MATAFMPQIPPAGTIQMPPYPWQQQQSSYYPQQQQQTYYPYQTPYPQGYQGSPPFQPQAPCQNQGRATPVQGWPNHAGEYMGPGYKYNTYSDDQDDTPDYNRPPHPQYGIPESKRGDLESSRSDPRFVFPDANGQPQGQPGGAGPDGERGLGATVLGGAGGAFLGHKMNKGAIGTIGGLALGAIAANAFEHHEKKKREERRESRALDEGYEDGEERPHHHSHSRGLDDDEYYSESRYDDDEEYRPRHHHHHHDYDNDYYRNDDYREEYYDRRGDDYREEYYDRRDDY